MNKLTREDIDVLISLIKKYGKDVILSFIKSKPQMKKYLPYIAAAGITLGGAGLYNHIRNGIDNEGDNIENVSSNNPYGMSDNDYELFQRKVEALKNEMNRVLAYKNKSTDDILFNIENVVYLCYKYNFDLTLLVAMMQGETHFGTSNRSIRTGSVISIGQYDNKTVVTYNNQDECFEPYIKIVQRDYLDNGNKSVDDILADGKFVNHMGKRYASDPQYEKKIRRIRNGLIRNVPVLAEPYEKQNS